jgi:ubiquinol-cytochrome c reductase iron-sulfur subunit
MSDHNERVMEPFHHEPDDNRPVDGKGYRGEAAVPNPGVAVHRERPTDVDPALERRAERQVAAMFGLATLLALGFCVAYYAVPEDAVIFGWRAHNFALGMTLGLSLLLIGLGAIQWAKKLMDDHEVVELRHPTSSTKEDRETAIEALTAGATESGIGRRPMIRNSLLGALAVLGLPAIVSLTDLGPVGDTHLLTKTVWKKGMRVVNDVSGAPIRPEELEVGKENWGVDGILCYSKICTHVGCPISLYEQQTHHVLCPCHQSTFDLSEGGRVTFGPAARPLPQLPLGLDEEGYLIAMDTFNEVMGASYPTMPRDD